MCLEPHKTRQLMEINIALTSQGMTITLVKGHEPALYGALKYCWSFLQNLQCKLERTIINYQTTKRLKKGAF